LISIKSKFYLTLWDMNEADTNGYSVVLEQVSC